jgi:hypothetical protein
MNMGRWILIVPGIFLAGCAAVRVVNTAPPEAECVQLGGVSAAAENEELSLRQLKRDVQMLGGNLLFMLMDTEEKSEDGSGIETRITKYGIAYRCSVF